MTRSGAARAGSPDPRFIRQDLQQIQQTMWNYAGIIHSPRRLARARRILLELRNAVQTALLVAHAALNPVSKGSHYIAKEN